MGFSCVLPVRRPVDNSLWTIVAGNRGGAGSVWSPTDSEEDPMTTTDAHPFTGWPADGRGVPGRARRRQHPRVLDGERAPLPHRAARTDPCAGRRADRGVRAAAGVPPARGPAVPPERRPVPHRHGHHRRRAGRHAVRGGAVGPGPRGAGRVPGVRSRAAAPVPQRRRRGGGGDARGGAGRAAPRRSRAGRGAGVDRATAAATPPTIRAWRCCGCAACTSTARGRRASGSVRRSRWSRSGRRGAPPGRSPTGWTPTSGRGTNRCSPPVGLPPRPTTTRRAEPVVAGVDRWAGHSRSWADAQRTPIRRRQRVLHEPRHPTAAGPRSTNDRHPDARCDAGGSA